MYPQSMFSATIIKILIFSPENLSFFTDKINHCMIAWECVSYCHGICKLFYHLVQIIVHSVSQKLLGIIC